MKNYFVAFVVFIAAVSCTSGDDDGPKLLLYLSTEVDSKDFVNLVDLKGIEGNFKYNIPDNTDLKKYKYVVVWCVDFSVSFGHAELK